MNKVYNLGLGCANFGQSYNGEYLEYPRARDLIHHALTSGITLFDTSSQYGLSEVYLKHALRQFSSSFHIVTKFSKERWRSQVLRSFKRFQNHSLDILWHNYEHKRENFPIIHQVMKFKNTRKFRLGASTYGFQDAEGAIKSGAFDVVEIEFNLFNWKTQSSLLSLANTYKVDLILRSIFARGHLTDRSEKKNPFHELAIEYNLPLEEIAFRFVNEFVVREWMIFGAESKLEIDKAIDFHNKPDLDSNLLIDINDINYQVDMRELGL